MSTMMLLDFYITSLIVVLIPGTGVIYTVSHGLFKGPLISIVAALGCTLGILPHIMASLLGLAAVLQASFIIFQIFKILGVLYLLYMAWGIWSESGELEINKPKDNKTLISICVEGFLINILNPKLSIFFLAFLPQFIPKDTQDPMYLIIVMSFIFMAMTFGIFVIYGIVASQFRTYVANSPKVRQWAQRSFAIAFAIFALKLSLT
jgi:threonine/homoserine/homoserine lactone efflux protein